MQKKTYSSVELTCVMQNGELSENACSTGVISKTAKGFLFEEEIRKGRPPRNPKLYDGKFISMVRMQNGRYQMHLKTMTEGFNKSTFAFGVYSEICNALKILE